MDQDKTTQKTSRPLKLSEGATRRILRDSGISTNQPPQCSWRELQRESAEAFERAWPRLSRLLAEQPEAPDLAALSGLRDRVARHLDRFLGCDLRTLLVEPLEACGWNGVAVYTPDPAHTALRVVASSDHTCVSTLSHSLYRHEHVLPDIEVDTFRACRAQRIEGGGFDPRFDPYLYHLGGHSRFKDRLFVPLVLVRREADCRVCQDFCLWRQHGSDWVPTVPPGYQLQVIGTVSVHRQELGSVALVSETLHRVTRMAPAVHAASLPGLLEALLGELMAVVGATHGAIHVGRDSEAIFLGEQAVVLRHGRGVSLGCREAGGVASPPRRDGIGADALKTGSVVTLTGTELAKRNSRLAGMGIETTVAAPMFNGAGERIGLAYLHYASAPPKIDVQSLVGIVASAIGIAVRCVERLMAPERLLTEAALLAQSTDCSTPDRVARIAHLVWTLLGSDFASCVVVSPEDTRTCYHLGRFVGQSGGAPRGRDLLQAALERIPIPSRAQYWDGTTRLWPPARSEFVHNEGIVASALVPIRDAAQTYGFLMVDYRLSHSFKRGFRGRENHLLETLGALIAAGFTRGSVAGSMDTAATLVATVQRGISFRMAEESSERCRAHVGITAC